MYISPGAVLIYEIASAGVGFALIKVTEGEDLLSPVPFTDALSVSVCLPECSTRFSIDL